MAVNDVHLLIPDSAVTRLSFTTTAAASTGASGAGASDPTDTTGDADPTETSGAAGSTSGAAAAVPPDAQGAVICD